jgi:hypothetical protein
LAWLCCNPPAFAEKRIALVVGNSAYQNIARLDNPKNDAVLMADTLGGLGFALIGDGAQLDLDKAALEIAVQNLAGKSRAPTSRCFTTPVTASRGLERN